jgi:predicted O-methyltransferase YrrM
MAGDATTIPLSARALRRASLYLAYRGAAQALRRAPSHAEPAAAFDFVNSFEFAGVRIPAVQVREEIVPFLGEVALEQPRTILEIGTAAGGSLFLLSRVAAADALLVSLDWARAGTNDRRRPIYEALARPGQRVEFLFADSHAPRTVERVRAELAGRSVDLLFIDGDHSQAGVRADWDMYGPLVRSGGLVAFHDIVPGSEEEVGGVPGLWQELKTADAREYVRDWQQGGYGIGVLRKP